MRSGHIAWIGAVVTFVAIVGVGMWPKDSTEKQASTDAVAQHDSDHPHPAFAAAAPSAAPAMPAGAALDDAISAPVSADPPEDGRAMMEAALASPDAGVRDDAAALSQALATESVDPAPAD